MQILDFAWNAVATLRMEYFIIFLAHYKLGCSRPARTMATTTGLRSNDVDALASALECPSTLNGQGVRQAQEAFDVDLLGARGRIDLRSPAQRFAADGL